MIIRNRTNKYVVIIIFKKKLVLLAHGFVGGDVSSRRTRTPVSREDT